MSDGKEENGEERQRAEKERQKDRKKVKRTSERKTERKKTTERKRERHRKNLKRVMVRDGICVSNSFYIIFYPKLAPIPNFIQIEGKTEVENFQ